MPPLIHQFFLPSFLPQMLKIVRFLHRSPLPPRTLALPLRINFFSRKIGENLPDSEGKNPRLYFLEIQSLPDFDFSFSHSFPQSEQVNRFLPSRYSKLYLLKIIFQK